MTQTRWFCETCAREWLYAYRWEPAQGCPGCHSSQIRQVRYTPAFAGADIPRETIAAPAVAAPRVVDAAPTPLPAQVAAAQDTMEIAQAHNPLVTANPRRSSDAHAIPEFA